MSSSTTKKVYLRRFSEPTLEGYINPKTYLRSEEIEILDRSAKVVIVTVKSVKGVYFVREFSVNAEIRQKTWFASRPKQNGLWVRLNFSDGDLLEGIVENNMLLMEGAGITITPPDPSIHAQKVFVPRLALSEVVVLGVVGKSGSTRHRSARSASVDQMDLFR